MTQPTPQMAGANPSPQSQYLAQALQNIGHQQQGNPQGLASNLLASALLQHAYQQNQLRAQQQAQGMQAQTGAPGASPQMQQQLGVDPNSGGLMAAGSMGGP